MKDERMKKVLLTGQHGFIGNNIKDYLEKRCMLFTPGRDELNLLDEDAVKKYIIENHIQIIVHAANPNPVKNQLDIAEKMFEDSLRIFMNLYNVQNWYERMYILGSGAEYDKRKNLKLVKEEEIGDTIPIDSYGFAKLIMNELIKKSDKLCNLRIFACYGPNDHESKFITHAIRCCIAKKDITIRQDCYFDYMHVYDLAKIICYFIDNVPQFNEYNVCTGKRILLSQIAEIVRANMNADNEILILKEGMNFEYTGDNSRLMKEIPEFRFIDIEEGIKMQIKSELKQMSDGEKNEA